MTDRTTGTTQPIEAILLPGLDGTGDLFEPFVAAAPDGIKPVVVTYPTNETSIAVFERLVREKLTDRCIVIAESFSGPIGVRVANDDRVQALILCNSFVSSPMPPVFRHLVFAPLLALPIPEFVIRLFLLGQQAEPALVRSAQSAIRRLPASVMANRIREVFRIKDQNALHSLRKPVLYLRGLSDNLVSERSWREVQKLRPDAKIVRMRGPHLLLQTSPAECWQAILKFVEG